MTDKLPTYAPVILPDDFIRQLDDMLGPKAAIITTAWLLSLRCLSGYMAHDHTPDCVPMQCELVPACQLGEAP